MLNEPSRPAPTEDKEAEMASKHQGRRFRRPKFTTVIALLALFAALGGSAYAGGKLINGKNIKTGTVKSKQLKDGTIKTKDINAKAVASLQGQQGPKGNPGANGVIDPISASNENSVNITDGQTLGVVTANVDAGTAYVVNAKTQLFGGPGVTQVDCTLNRGGVQDTIAWNPPANNKRAPVSLEALIPAGGASISLGCGSDGGTSSASISKIIAIPVG
jgi:hypothetical protein